MPTAAAYIIAATVGAPALTYMGVDVLATHLFVFWYAILSAITPPVALAAYAAATLAKDDPMKIAIEACKLGIVAFIVPFLMIYKPSIILVYEAPLATRLLAIFSSFIAAYALGVGITGYLSHSMKIYERILMIAVGLLLFVPTSAVLDIIGIAIIAIAIFFHIKNPTRRSKQQKGEGSSTYCD